MWKGNFGIFAGAMPTCFVKEVLNQAHCRFSTKPRKMNFYSKKILLLLLLSPASHVGLFAQKYSNEFLSIGVSARAQGMGNAVIASVEDVTAGYWNPAGLANFSAEQGLQIGAMHSEWFAGVGKFDYLGMTLPLANNNRRIALSLIRFGVDDIPNTLSLFESDGTVNYDNIVSFSAADYAFLGSYAQRLPLKNGKLLNFGGNVKIVRRVIGSFANSWGFGIDLGAQYKSGNLRLGAMARDITTTFNAWHVTFSEDEKQVLLATGNELPGINSLEITKPQIILGAAYLFEFNKFSLLSEVNVTATTDGKRNTLVSGDPISLDPNIGVELNYNDFIYLRAGLSQLQKEKDFDNRDTYISRPAIGIGMRLYSLMIDYAYTDLGDSQNRYSHVISLLLDLKPKKENH